jgi:hypothetical protein
MKGLPDLYSGISIATVVGLIGHLPLFGTWR